jgi:methionyl-tRNA synthetase
MEKITYDDFAKLELRTARILEAEKVEGTAKLVKLLIDIGSETRTIVAGVGETYKAEELKNKNIVVLTNLEPKTLRGVESNGMLLAASAEGKPILLTIEKDVPPGTEIR